MMKKVLAALILPAAGLMLAGCVAAPAGPVDESANFAPVSYDSVCLLENDAVKSPKLVDAVESGLKKAGLKVTRLKAGTGPYACPFVLTYDVPSGDGLVSVIRFQTFEHGIPRVDAAGRAPAGRALTVGAVEAYAKELIDRLKARAGETAPAAGPQASVVPPAAAQTFRSTPEWQSKQTAR